MKALILIVGLSLTACTPKIYVVDRQTVLEEEAAGRWPKFEEKLLDHSRGKGPTPFASVPMSSKRAKLYRVLNAPITGESQP
jgi:hypothetical protein